MRDWITGEIESVLASLPENLVKDECGLHRLVSVKLKLELYKLYLLLTSIIKLNHYTQWTCMSVIPYHKPQIFLATLTRFTQMMQNCIYG